MALYFDGVGDHVSHGADPSISAAMPTGTILCWLKTPATIDDGHIVCNRNGAATGYLLYLWDDGDISCAVDRATSDVDVVSSSQEVTADAWNFVGVGWDTTGANGDQELYIGDLASTVAEVTGYATQLVGSGAVQAGDNLLIGNRTGYLNQDWSALTADVAWVGIWDRKLTLGEIRAQQFRPHKTTGCVLFVHLGYNGTGTQADWSGEGNNGTVTGATVADHVPLGLPFWMAPQHIFAAPPPLLFPPVPGRVHIQRRFPHVRM